MSFASTLKNIFSDKTLTEDQKNTYPKPGRSLFNRLANPVRASRMIEFGDWLKDQHRETTKTKPGL